MSLNAEPTGAPPAAPPIQVAGLAASPLSEFFIFNPTLSKREDEEEKKILFYFPSHTSIATQHKQIGLCQGMIQFTQPFSPTKPVQSIHTSKHAYFLSNPEPDIWLVIVMDNPPVAPASTSLWRSDDVAQSPQPGQAGQQQQAGQGQGQGAAGQQPPPPATPQGQRPTPAGPTQAQQAGAGSATSTEEELDESRWGDHCMLSLLSSVYESYRLLHGRIGAVEPDEARKRLAGIIPSALAAIPWGSADLLTSLAGVHWLSLERNVYLQVHKCVSAAEHALPDLRATAIAHRDHLVWSSLPQQDTRALYRLLASALGFGAPGDLLSPRATPQMQVAREQMLEASEFFAAIRNRIRRRSRFLTGPEDPADSASVRNCVDVYLSTDGPRAKPQGLVVYQLFDFTFAFVAARRVAELDSEFFRVLDRHIESQFTEQFLASVVYDHHQRMNAFDEQYRYIYYNHMNLALKTSLVRNTDLSPGTMDLIDGMHDDFEDSSDVVCELLVRTNADKWVVGRRSEQREFYIVFDNSKNANLGDINEEVKKLSGQYFANIFITE